MDWEPEEVVEATRKAGVQTTAEWLDLINPSRALAQLTQPVMPLKKGHVAMLMASGMMGTVRLTDEEGRPMLIKGRVIKVVEKSEETDSKDFKGGGRNLQRPLRYNGGGAQARWGADHPGCEGTVRLHEGAW